MPTGGGLTSFVHLVMHRSFVQPFVQNRTEQTDTTEQNNMGVTPVVCVMVCRACQGMTPFPGSTGVCTMTTWGHVGTWPSPANPSKQPLRWGATTSTPVFPPQTPPATAPPPPPPPPAHQVLSFVKYHVHCT